MHASFSRVQGLKPRISQRQMLAYTSRKLYTQPNLEIPIPEGSVSLVLDWLLVKQTTLSNHTIASNISLV